MGILSAPSVLSLVESHGRVLSGFLRTTVLWDSWLSELGYQAVPWAAAAKAGAPDLYKSSFQGDTDNLVFYYWSELEGEGREVSVGFTGPWEGSQLAPRCPII